MKIFKYGIVYVKFNARKNMHCLKWIALAVLLFAKDFAGGHENTRELKQYNVSRSNYAFSKVFDMSAEGDSLGSVVKSVFHITSHYDAYDRFGRYEGSGISRLLCLGIFYTWGVEIDLYDENGFYQGMIDGQVVTTEPGKYSFYDGEGKRVAIAYLDQNKMGFSLVDPGNSAFVLARLTRNFILHAVDNWDVSIYHPERIPPILIKIFAAFVCDRQSDFKADL